MPPASGPWRRFGLGALGWRWPQLCGPAASGSSSSPPDAAQSGQDRRRGWRSGLETGEGHGSGVDPGSAAARDCPAYGARNVQKVTAGTGEALPGRSGLAVPADQHCLITGEEPGSRRGAGRESEAAVVPVGPAGEHNLPGGKGRCFVHARAGRPGSVGAGNTASSTLAAVRGDRVRALQHVLYRAAKADPDRRFHSLRDKVYREDVLWRAWIAERPQTARRASTGITSLTPALCSPMASPTTR
jgi:hypothetical protein